MEATSLQLTLMMFQRREKPEVPEADICCGVCLETHLRQDRRGLGLPRPAGDHHGPGELRHGLHYLALWPRQGDLARLCALIGRDLQSDEIFS